MHSLWGLKFKVKAFFFLVCNYFPKQMYVVVVAMDLYEKFMPWSQSSRILWHKHDDDEKILLNVKIKVGFKFFVERYISHVQLAETTQPDQIKYPSPIYCPPKKKPTFSLFPSLCVIFLYYQKESYRCAIKLQSSSSACKMLIKLKFLGYVFIASSLVFQALNVHGWWWSFQHVEKNIYGFDLVVVVITSTRLLFVLVFFTL